MPRDYLPLLDRIAPPGSTPDVAMRAIVDGLWDAFGTPPTHAPLSPSRLAEVIKGDDSGPAPAPISWVGFYTWSRSAPDELTLGPRRDKPACSPIGLHGACGQCWSSRRPLVVTDVANLGAGYIACDPRDRSEVVVPCLNPDGSAWGVLDIDSHAANAFDAFDALSLVRLLRHAGLSTLVCEAVDDVKIV